MKRNWMVGIAAVVVLVGLFLVLRPGGTDTESGSTPSAMPHGNEDVPSTSPGMTMTGDDVPVIVGVKGGEVTGPGTATVSVGDRVHLTVTADVTDEVHVHGYDVMGEVGPDTPAHVEFIASTPGVFEVELEGSGLLLVRIQVEL